MYIPDDIIQDKEGNEFAGIDRGDWTFSTIIEEDNEAPEIKGDIKVNDDNEILIIFDEEVQWVRNSSSNNVVHVTNLDDHKVVVSDDVEINDNELTVKFDRPLDEGLYGVTIQAGIIEDLAGNDFKGIGINDDYTFEVE